jgi:hypothetical protein
VGVTRRVCAASVRLSLSEINVGGQRGGIQLRVSHGGQPAKCKR